jgi:hypothetical protein
VQVCTSLCGRVWEPISLFTLCGEGLINIKRVNVNTAMQSESASFMSDANIGSTLHSSSSPGRSLDTRSVQKI